MPIIFLLAALWSGTYTVNLTQIDDWPALAITEHITSDFPAGACEAPGSMGCSLVDLAAGTCDVYLTPLAANIEPIRAHELEHCAGWDHAPYRMQDLFDTWVAEGRPTTRKDAHAPVVPQAPVAVAVAMPDGTAANVADSPTVKAQ